MRRFKTGIIVLSGFLLVWVAPGGKAQTVDEAQKRINFQEVYSLVRSNLVGVSETELEQAAALGLIRQLGPKVALVADEKAKETPAKPPVLKKTALYDDAYAYFQVTRVDRALPQEVGTAFERIRSEAKGKLNGLILDLRFAKGEDYTAAAETADLFITTEQPLISWSNSKLQSKAKTNAITTPVVVLANRETAGAAEALLAVLRRADVGLVIGSRTAGQALAFNEFPLGNGQKLRVATGRIEIAGKELPEVGFDPDIQITAKLEEERAYMEDPYKVPGEFAGLLSSQSGTNQLFAGSSTNRPNRRRFNEADLLRMQQEGTDRNSGDTASNDRPARPVINDPALGRALDFLKGLALVENRR